MKSVPAVENKGRERGGEETMKTWNESVTSPRSVRSGAGAFWSNWTALPQLHTLILCLGFRTRHREDGKWAFPLDSGQWVCTTVVKWRDTRIKG